MTAEAVTSWPTVAPGSQAQARVWPVPAVPDLGVQVQGTKVRGYRPELYTDVSALLNGGELEPLTPLECTRTDGVGLFYRGQVNTLFGDPEAGKTWLALAAVVEALNAGRSALIIDLDHNGAHATVNRLLDMGADETTIRNPQRFRYTEPEDADQVTAVVKDSTLWAPAVVIVDSMGELLPIFGANSNSSDDYTRVHSKVLKPLALAGCTVVVIDHLAKNTDSKAFGSQGTAAKKRAIGGTSLRVTVVDAFTPGSGGRSHVTINKDRHGGLRKHSVQGEKEPLAATFHLIEDDGALSWKLYPGQNGERATINAEQITDDDLDQVRRLNPPPTTVRGLKQSLGCSTDRAGALLKAWRAEGSPSTVDAPPYLVPDVPNVGVQVQGTSSDRCGICSAPISQDAARASGVCEKSDPSHQQARTSVGTL